MLSRTRGGAAPLDLTVEEGLKQRYLTISPDDRRALDGLRIVSKRVRRGIS